MDFIRPMALFVLPVLMGLRYLIGILSKPFPLRITCPEHGIGSKYDSIKAVKFVAV